MNNQELLRYCNEHLNYDPETGILTWKKRCSKFSNVVIGSEAGSIGTKGYRRITFTDGQKEAHRIAFLMYYGYLPDCIDHIDRDPLNNKISNLRCATVAENTRNVGLTKSNKSGYKGISWNSRDMIWQCMISYKSKLKNIGSFKCKHEAARVYNLAARMYHGKFAYTNEINI
jgi:hypothetical protein